MFLKNRAMFCMILILTKFSICTHNNNIFQFYTKINKKIDKELILWQELKNLLILKELSIFYIKDKNKNKDSKSNITNVESKIKYKMMQKEITDCDYTNGKNYKNTKKLISTSFKHYCYTLHKFYKLLYDQFNQLLVEINICVEPFEFNIFFNECKDGINFDNIDEHFTKIREYLVLNEKLIVELYKFNNMSYDSNISNEFINERSKYLTGKNEILKTYKKFDQIKFIKSENNVTNKLMRKFQIAKKFLLKFNSKKYTFYIDVEHHIALINYAYNKVLINIASIDKNTHSIYDENKITEQNARNHDIEAKISR